MYPSFGPVVLLGGDTVCHTPGLYSSVKSHAAICKLGARAPGSWLTGYVFSPQLSGTRTLKGGVGCVLEHYGGHHYGLLVPGSLMTYQCSRSRGQPQVDTINSGRGDGSGPQRCHLALHPSSL